MKPVSFYFQVAQWTYVDMPLGERVRDRLPWKFKQRFGIVCSYLRRVTGDTE